MNKIEHEIKAKQLDENFHRIANKLSRVEKIPRNYGTSYPLYPSEIHTINAIGLNPGINVTELAKKQGVTKGAVSQVIAKLVKKKLIIKMKEVDNDKTIFLKLSEEGHKAFEGHHAFHAKMHFPLVDLLENATQNQVDFIEQFLMVLESFCDQALSGQP